MDQKEFDRLQTATQWAVDEAKAERPAAEGHLYHDQDNWGYGKVTSKAVSGKYAHAPFMARTVCASSCCLAGNIVLAEGDTFVVPDWSSAVEGQIVVVEYCMDATGTVHKIEDRALDLIGVEFDQLMFDPEQDVDTLVERVGDVAEEHGFTLDIK